ncbi:MAG: radical SAM protein [Candidatus Latescibacterota bacterium]|nr:MAG: radical SAM protein [Candidatus Latescibacterota bacterium]
MNYVFGPVPSRRLGRSLGIDPVPIKTCNWNCIYCQLGRSIPLVNERRDFFPPEEIIREIEEALSQHDPSEIDWITFAGSGEPLLHASIGRLIRAVKSMTRIPVALLTNGSFLHLPDVRGDALAVDAVMPTIDAGTKEMFRKVNRPHPGISYDQYIDGLVSFRKEYKGKLWPEVMLVRGVNDTEESLRDIADVLRRVKPDEVHISLPVRPPAETWIEPPDDEGLLRALAILGGSARVVHPVDTDFDMGGFETAVDAVIGIVSRHPMREDEIEDTLARWTPGEVKEALAELQASGKVQIVERHGVRFWTSASLYYPGREKSERTAPKSKRAAPKNKRTAPKNKHSRS